MGGIVSSKLADFNPICKVFFRLNIENNFQSPAFLHIMLACSVGEYLSKCYTSAVTFDLNTASVVLGLAVWII